jgi:hypothetical protein
MPSTACASYGTIYETSVSFKRGARVELTQDYIDATIARHEGQFVGDATGDRRARLIRGAKKLAKTIGIGAAYLGATSYGLGYVMEGMVLRG